MSTVTTLPFNEIKAKLQANFKAMADKPLFYVEVDRDGIYEQYLASFGTLEERQEHTCNACKSFLRQYGGIVTLEDNKVTSIWDGVNETLSQYIHSRPVTDILLVEQKKCGVDKNWDPKLEVFHNHFFLEMPAKFVVKDIPPKQSQARDDKNVLKRSLEELTVDATETVLELIGQNSLYRGNEFEPLLKKFVLLQRQYKKVSEAELEALEQGLFLTSRDNFCWATSVEYGSVVSRIRNTAIGTLLIDLSGGMDLDQAVGRFEKVVAPTNYKRPTSLVTPKMVEKAKETLAELGLLDSLNRRYATEADIQVCNILFKDKPQAITDVFDEMSKETIVNPKTLTKVEEISIEDFIKNVVPTAKGISVLLENNHMNNFVSIITSQDPEAKGMFKWNNNFSWSYAGAVTDSIKERVKEAGGNVEGELRTSLSWHNSDDLDIHVIEPNGQRIYYGAKQGSTGGLLDIDMNAGYRRNAVNPVENIIWTNKNKLVEGEYQVIVNNYAYRGPKNPGYTIQVECQGQIFDFASAKSPSNGANHNICTFTYSKTDGVTFKTEVNSKSNVVSKEKWGVSTNQFHKATKIMLSPNHWDGAVGNKHFFFMLEGCKSDETPRPFFNEFLQEDLLKHRKVFEILGGKVKIEESDNQLSGIGFSDTQPAVMIVKVKSKFDRLLKIKF